MADIELLEQEDTKPQPLRESLSLEVDWAGFNLSDRPGGLGIAICDTEDADHIRHTDIIHLKGFSAQSDLLLGNSLSPWSENLQAKPVFTPGSLSLTWTQQGRES